MNPLSGVEAALVRAFGSVVAPGGARGSLLILIFHRVLPVPDPLLPNEPDARLFAAQIDLLRENFRILPLSEGVERLFSGSLPPRAACITLDDGYANNFAVAAPILAARRMPATVFVATGFIGKTRMWNDTVIEAVRNAGVELDLTSIGLGRYTLHDDAARRAAIDVLLDALKYRDPAERAARALAIADRAGGDLPQDVMMNEEQIRALAGRGIAVGAHTVSHPILARLDEETARREILESRSVLQSITGAPVTAFAYPNGRPLRDYDRLHVEIVRRAGFAAAVSTAWGAAGRGADRFQLPRMMAWDRSARRFAARLLRTYREQRTAAA
ncbi:MAG: polysaccharide deacetylase family protein [Gammaproteobacteria bacterium]